MPQATGNSNFAPPSTALVRAAIGVGVVHPLEARLDEAAPSRPMQSGSMRSAKKAMSSPRSSSTARTDVLEEGLGQVGVGGQVGEGDLGLDHPELGQVAGGVGVLGPERRAERVHPAQGQAVGLDVELARDGQVRLPAEEVLGEVDLPSGVRGRLARSRVETRNIAPGPLGVVGGDDRGVDPEEAVLVEEAVHGHRQAVPHPGDGAEGVGAGPQVGDLAQVLERVLLGGDRVGLGVVDPADDLDRLGLDLDRLALALGLDQRRR